MKTLYLIRHAETQAGSPSGRDHDRILTAKGENEARAAAAFLAKRLTGRALLLASDAARTVATSKVIGAACGLAPEITAGLYLAPADHLLEVVTQTDDAIDSLILIAHNPGLAELSWQLSGEDSRVFSFPTASIAVFESDSWDMLSGTARLADFFTP